VRLLAVTIYSAQLIGNLIDYFTLSFPAYFAIHAAPGTPMDDIAVYRVVGFSIGVGFNWLAGALAGYALAWLIRRKRHARADAGSTQVQRPASQVMSPDGRYVWVNNRWCLLSDDHRYYLEGGVWQHR
jgi:hypothetical protein